ncbi:MAG: ATP-binding cassette domain-containing protein [Candidatus Bathyarchaeia archaeon]|jgi:ABC-2 type transport system ATP-binding protein
MKTNIIEAENLTKTYKKTVKAVDHISFSVEEGELFGFLGPNGAGKTTTIKMLTTLASVTEGKALVAGYDVGKDPGAVRKNIGIVPQELTADDELKGAENLLLSAKLHHVPNDAARKKAKELLELLELEGASHRQVKTFSGGMRRRLQLAMGLIHDPKILFLDEPTLGLDIQTRQNMWTYIRDLNREKGITVFMTTHYLEEADSLCDRIAIIDNGVIKLSGSPSELKAKLGGTILTLQLTDSVDISNMLSGIQDVTEVAKEGKTYKIKLTRTERALPAIVETVTKKGLKISDITLAKPTLDQVFLQITGNTMRDGATNGDSFGQRVLIERLK